MSKTFITVVETMSCQVKGEEPNCMASRFPKIVNTDEQMYERKRVVGSDWEKLDFGWLNKVSMVSIVNEEGTDLDKNPSKEEKQDIARRILAVGGPQCQCNWIISPGESMRGVPESTSDLYIRSLHGSAKFTLYAFPG